MTGLRKAIALCNGSVPELARKSGLTESAIYHWLSGAREMSPESAMKIEAGLKKRVTRKQLLPQFFGGAS